MNRPAYILLLSLAGILTSCSFAAKGVITDDTTEQYQLYDYYTDEYGNEGIVVYLATKKDPHQIIVLSADESNAPWGPMGEVVYKGDSVSKDIIDGYNGYSFGVAIHQAMHAAGIDRYPAQAWCDKKNTGEPHPRGGSWRLPSYYEWRLIMNLDNTYSWNKPALAEINKALELTGGTPLNADHIYWTCTEDFDGYLTFKEHEADYDQQNRAVIVSPEGKSYSNKDRWIKKNNYYVRAIKYVYFKSY